MGASTAFAFRLWQDKDEDCQKWLDEQLANRPANVTRSERLREIVTALVADRCGQPLPRSVQVMDAAAFRDEVAQRVIELQRMQS